ncbi:DNA polymerase IV [Acutalibacter caecimuris]|uniref:DNA polymerase IV n=1 Tax=Acutalibacter caecimuris TaxID=3093657 RepID=UPI002AC8FC3A|nr:DNA polymerase IV [Acutalibacter sp. M00118]
MGGYPRTNGILHVDMNNFYASVETLYAPAYRDVPMAVAGDKESRHGIILAKNMLAKARGVKTAEPIWQAMRKCPDLRILPPHHERYAMFSKMAKELYAQYTDQVEPFSLDECWLDVTGSARLFGCGREIAEDIRRRVKAELGLTVSVGVSFNKVFAKLGSDYKKPDAVTEFGPEEMERIIWGMPCEELLFVGPSTSKALHRHGIHTIGDIARMDMAVMRRLLGRMGETLWVYANGLDDTPVQRLGEGQGPKSIGSSTTLPRDITQEADIRATLFGLAETVARQLRGQGLKAGEVQITVRNKDFQEFQRQTRLAAPVCDSRSLYRAALELYHREDKKWEVRLLGVRAGRLTPAGESQVSLFEAADGLERLEKLESAVDRVRERFGSGCIDRAFVMQGRRGDKPG